MFLQYNKEFQFFILKIKNMFFILKIIFYLKQLLIKLLLVVLIEYNISIAPSAS